MSLRRWALAAAFCCAGCDADALADLIARLLDIEHPVPPEPPPPPVDDPPPPWRVVAGDYRYNDVFGIATHNAYWLDRHPGLDPYGSGAQEDLRDQLLHERVRAVELDVHSDDAHPGVWTVYHTDQPSFSQCNPLDDCLRALAQIHALIPDHEVINVIIELKNTDYALTSCCLQTTHHFSATHTIEAFDRTLWSALGGAIYTPADFLSRCPAGRTLTACAKEVGWPTVSELRGKFIVNLIGNWSNAVYDWAAYANAPPGIRARVAFPMRCIFDAWGDGVFRGGTGGLAGGSFAPLPAGWLERARAESVFWQVEHLEYAGLPAFLAENGVVRGPTINDEGSARAQLRRGIHMISTDAPWALFWSREKIARRLYDPREPDGFAAPDALAEPGARIYHSGDATPAFAGLPATGDAFLETTVSTTRAGEPLGGAPARPARGEGEGCVEARVDNGDFARLCRKKHSPADAPSEQERVTLFFTAQRGTRETVETFVVDGHQASSGPGSSLALSVRGSTVGAWSRRGATWLPLGEASLGDAPAQLGLAASWDVLFVATRLTRSGAAVSVRARELSGAAGFSDLE